MKNLYIDFDGVILDTIPALYEALAEAHISIEDEPKMRQFIANLDWNKLLKTTPVIGDSLNELQQIIDSHKYNVAILTHVNSLAEAIEKVNYLRQYFKDITIIPVPKAISKTKMVETKDAILVDDYAGNLREWALEGGIGIRFNREGESKGFKVIKNLKELL